MRPHYLDGAPRIHYQHLEFRESELEFGNDIIYHNEQPYSGIAWDELRGVLSEDTIENGLRHGVCVKTYDDGTRAEEGHYQCGEPVGQIKEWYKSGQLSSIVEYDAFSKKLHQRDYNHAGILIKEIIEKPARRLSFWTDQGTLAYRSENGIDEIYSPEEKCVIRKLDKDKNYLFYDDDQLAKHAFSMLVIKIGLVKYPVLNWIKQKVAENNQSVKRTLLTLLNHPNVGIAEDALFIIEQDNYLDAIPFVLPLISSPREKKSGEGGFSGTLAQLAQRVLAKLLPYANQQTREEAERYLEVAANIRTKRAKRREVQGKKIDAIKQTWPQLEATYYETYSAEGSMKSVDQLFTDDARYRSIFYFHVYIYMINGKAYRACFSSPQKIAEPKKNLRYRKKNPDQNFFCNQ